MAEPMQEDHFHDVEDDIREEDGLQPGSETVEDPNPAHENLNLSGATTVADAGETAEKEYETFFRRCRTAARAFLFQNISSLTTLWRKITNEDTTRQTAEGIVILVAPDSHLIISGSPLVVNNAKLKECAYTLGRLLQHTLEGEVLAAKLLNQERDYQYIFNPANQLTELYEEKKGYAKADLVKHLLQGSSEFNPGGEQLTKQSATKRATDLLKAHPNKASRCQNMATCLTCRAAHAFLDWPAHVPHLFPNKMKESYGPEGKEWYKALERYWLEEMQAKFKDFRYTENPAAAAPEARAGQDGAEQAVGNAANTASDRNLAQREAHTVAEQRRNNAQLVAAADRRAAELENVIAIAARQDEARQQLDSALEAAQGVAAPVNRQPAAATDAAAVAGPSRQPPAENENATNTRNNRQSTAGKRGRPPGSGSKHGRDVEQVEDTHVIRVSKTGRKSRVSRAALAVTGGLAQNGPQEGHPEIEEEEETAT